MTCIHDKVLPLVKFTWNKSSLSHYHTQRPLSHFIYRPSWICLRYSVYHVFSLSALTSEVCILVHIVFHTLNIQAYREYSFLSMYLHIHSRTNTHTKQTYRRFVFSCASNYHFTYHQYFLLHLFNVYFTSDISTY